MKVYNFLKNNIGAKLFKKPDKPSCIKVILANKSKSFQTSQIIETGISDFQKMVTTVLKVYLKKNGPSVIQYRDYKIFLMINLEMIYLMN